MASWKFSGFLHLESNMGSNFFHCTASYASRHVGVPVSTTDGYPADPRSQYEMLLMFQASSIGEEA